MSANYHRLRNSDSDTYTSLQFKRSSEPKLPVKSIITACVLFGVGSILIVVGSLLVSGHIDPKYSESTWPVLVLGCLTFIPGFYHLRIAVWAYLEYPGFSFEDIPDYQD